MKESSNDSLSARLKELPGGSFLNLRSVPPFAVGATLAVLATWLMAGLPAKWLMALAAALLYLSYRTYLVYLGRIEDEQRHVREMADLHLATIEALALAIDAKDQTSQSHIRRVQVYAAAVARGIGMSENDIQGVKTAALLHDIGKLAVPEHILSKPGPLTPEEFQKIRTHPQVGAEIISCGAVPVSGGAADPEPPRAVGRQGLSRRAEGRGDSARRAHPVGRRLLRRADVGAAVPQGDELRRARSACCSRKRARALDPACRRRRSSSCCRRCRAEAAAARAGDAAAARRRRADADGRPRRPACTPEPANEERVRGHRARAPRDLRALRDRAGDGHAASASSDTMALISSKLSNLVPFSCGALFLYDEDTDTLRCRFATGIDADIIQQLAIRNGEGLTGWVARNRRPLVNARPSADFEAAGLSVAAHDAAVGAGLPAALQRAVHRHALGLSRRAGVLPRRSPPAARSRLGAGGRGHQQLDGVRADAGRLADRSADRPAEHALHVHAPHARARARRAAEVRSRR